MKLLRVAVLMGGCSSEHDVSMRSGKKVAANLSPERFETIPVVIHKDGLWEFPGETPIPFAQAAPYLSALGVDCVFLALHGAFGEDGRLQGMLDLLRLPYTGSGCIASGMAIDKVRSKALVRDAGIPVAPDIVLDRESYYADPKGQADYLIDVLGLPCVVKSPCQGSSLGMAITWDEASLESALPDLFELDDTVLAEAYMAGTEVTCGILDIEPGKRPRALPLTEIRPVQSIYFDYEAKYTPGATEEITPALIDPSIANEVQTLAVKVHRIIGCRGLSRSDFIIVNGAPKWLEVNTIPGMTETSLFPQAAAAAGIPFGQLMGMLVDGAIAYACLDFNALTDTR